MHEEVETWTACAIGLDYEKALDTEGHPDYHRTTSTFGFTSISFILSILVDVLLETVPECCNDGLGPSSPPFDRSVRLSDFRTAGGRTASDFLTSWDFFWSHIGFPFVLVGWSCNLQGCCHVSKHSSTPCDASVTRWCDHLYDQRRKLPN
jgi:hypothetical protein